MEPRKVYWIIAGTLIAACVLMLIVSLIKGFSLPRVPLIVIFCCLVVPALNRKRNTNRDKTLRK